MKRLLIAVGIIAALVVSASAYAAANQFLGVVKKGGSTSFTIGTRNKVVRDFHWNDVPVTCEGLPTHKTSTYTFSHTMKVRHAHFHGLDLAPQGGRLRVTGALSNHGRRASGTLKINGDISEGNACKSGKLQWHAHRVPGH
jgi:hypothetical protein